MAKRVIYDVLYTFTPATRTIVIPKYIPRERILLITNTTTNQVIFKCQDKGLILFWLLFEDNAIRITPPLTISNQEIEEGCGIIIEAMNEIVNGI